MTTNELSNISSQLWLPNKIEGKTDETKCNTGSQNGTLTQVESKSWFKINLITNTKNNNIYCKPCNVYNTYDTQKNEKLIQVQENNEDDFDVLDEICDKQKIIDDCQEKYNPFKQKNKINIKKEVQFDNQKKPCQYIVTSSNDNINYGRKCGNLCVEKNDVCKKHIDKKSLKYDLLADNLCKHIITQRSGGKNESEIIDRKGMICGDFTFDSKNPNFCYLHSKRHKDPELEGKETSERSFHVRCYPDKDQCKLLEKIFGDKRKTYNLCIKNNAGSTMTESQAKKKYVTDVDIKVDNKENELKFLKDTPEDIRTFAVGEYFTNYKNANDAYQLKKNSEEYKKENYLNYKKKDIKKPVFNYQNKKDGQSINIDKKLVKISDRKIVIYSKLFKNKAIKIKTRQQKRDKKLNQILDGIINHDVKLIKTITNKYYFCFMMDMEIEQKKTETKVCAIDTNIRNLGSSYSEKECYEFGADIYDELRPMVEEKEKLKKIYSTNIKKIIGNKIKGNKINEKEFNESKMNYRKYEEKIENRINDLHYKVISKLMDANYTLILIPKLNINQLLRKQETPKTVKKFIQIERHMKFLARLKEKAKLKGVTIKIINENMTTQTCGNCFSTYKFSGEIYKCEKCKIIMGRDINSARNIYLKEIGKMVEFVNYLKTI